MKIIITEKEILEVLDAYLTSKDIEYKNLELCAKEIDFDVQKCIVYAEAELINT